MKELVVVSGKGGTGKTSIVASFGVLADGAVLADCDVDASDLHLVLEPTVLREEEFSGGSRARILPDACVGCAKCRQLCRFDAVHCDGRGNDFVGKNGFAYAIDGAASEIRQPGSAVRRRGQAYHLSIGGARILFEDRTDVAYIQIRHRDIHEHQRRAQPVRDLQYLAPLVCGNRTVALSLERLRQHLEIQRIVVDEQNGVRRQRGRFPAVFHNASFFLKDYAFGAETVPLPRLTA